MKWNTPIQKSAKNEKFIHALTAANIILSASQLSAQNDSWHDRSELTLVEIKSDDIQNLRNSLDAGCGNAGCGANNSC